MVHEAVFTIPGVAPGMEEYEDNDIGNVRQSGWKIGDRILRPAKVGVVKK